MTITGLIIVASICDQGPTNRTAIESLVFEARQNYLRKGETPKRRIICDKVEIILIYDVPYLIKGIRNNLLKKNLIWEHEDGDICANWEDVINAF